MIATKLLLLALALPSLASPGARSGDVPSTTNDVSASHAASQSPWSTLSRWKDLGETCAAWATTAAVILGGWWAWRRFGQSREAKPWANVEHAVVSKKLTDEKWLLRVTVSVHNKGKVRLNLGKGEVRVHNLLPYTASEVKGLIDQLAKPDERQTEAAWDLLEKVDFSERNLRHELEPTESDHVHFDFFLEKTVKAVIVYSHIENSTKPGIGWNETTLHDLTT